MDNRPIPSAIFCRYRDQLEFADLVLLLVQQGDQLTCKSIEMNRS